jgi:Zn-dependent peptidase ImmA (M78 family)
MSWATFVMHKFPSPDMETEANNFASALLMPKNEITIALRSRRGRYGPACCSKTRMAGVDAGASIPRPIAWAG